MSSGFIGDGREQSSSTASGFTPAHAEMLSDFSYHITSHQIHIIPSLGSQHSTVNGTRPQVGRKCKHLQTHFTYFHILILDGDTR